MPLFWPWGQALCPFCFEYFDLRTAPWRPLNPNVNPRPDERLGRFFNQTVPPDMSEIVPPELLTGWKSVANPFVLDNSRIRDHDRICPHCHMPLPLALATGQMASKVIAVIGEMGSGKSVFFGVLIHLLTKGHLARDAGFGVVSQTSFDIERREKVPSSTLYESRYGQYLFGEVRQVPDKTQPFDIEPAMRAPLIYRLQFFRSRADGQPVKPAVITHATDLVLFDTSGEVMENHEVMLQTQRYLTRAAGIIVLVNPLRLEGVRKQLPSELRERQDTESVSRDVLENFFNLFDRDPRYAMRSSIDVPVAIALTKMDMLRPLLDAGSQVLKAPRHHNGYDAEDGERVSAEVREYLDRWAGGTLTTNLNRLKRAGFCAISSLGCLPNEDRTIPAFSPHRVADPLFWILHQMQFLSATRTTAPTGGAA